MSDLVVLMPVRDAAETLEESLASLRRQTFSDFSVVAVEDGSRDETPRILARVGRLWSRERGPRLRLIKLEPGAGVAAALSRAQEMVGEETFVARHDADDLSDPRRFARQVEYLRGHPEIGVLATGIHTEKVGGLEPTAGWRRYEAWLSSCLAPEEIARNLWIESPLPHPTVMMRRSAFERVGGYRRTDWPEDYDLWLRMLRAGIRMAKLPEALYVWRDHPARASRTQEIYSQASFLACRAHHLAASLRGDPVSPNDPGPRPSAQGDREVSVILWGAGRDGRRAAKALMAEGIRIECFLDIDPKKIGRRAYGRPILDAGDWLGAPVSPAGERALVLAAVGTAGARELIRSRLRAADLEEGTDFLCIA